MSSTSGFPTARTPLDARSFAASDDDRALDRDAQLDGFGGTDNAVSDDADNRPDGTSPRPASPRSTSRRPGWPGPAGAYAARSQHVIQAPGADAYSLVEDAEEMSDALDVLLDDKDDDERDIDADASLYEIDDAALDTYLHDSGQNDAAGAARLNLLVTRLLGEPDRSYRDWLDHCQSDPGRLYAALRCALAAHDSTEQPRAADGGTRRRLLTLLDDVIVEHGSRIRGAINTAAAWRTGETPESPALEIDEISALQRSYTDIVQGQASLSATLRRVLDMAAPPGALRPADALTRFIVAVGRDLSATHPSVAPVRLRALLNDKQHATDALTVLLRSDVLVSRLPAAGARMEAAGPDAADALRRAALHTMQQAISASEQPLPAAEPFIALAKRMANDDGAATLMYLTGFVDILRQLPVRMFADARQRECVRDAAQLALDTLIDEDDGDV